MAIVIDREQILAAANATRESGNMIESEAGKMRRNVANLREALKGIPRLAVADDLEHLDQLLAQVSESLAQSDNYLKDVVNKVDAFVASLGN